MPEEKTELKWSIRPCREEDLDAARAICEETSSIPLRDEKDRQFLLLTFCDPYVLYAAESFVAADESDRPVGYIFCTADTRRFFRAFRKNILPQISLLGPRYAIMGRGVCFFQTLCSVFAPAHLHIDLTASARNQGIGTQLIRTLKAHLAAQGISRLSLSVSQKNVSAIRFYKRNGFRPVITAFGECLMLTDTEK